jgi:hypothetical protein
VWILKALGLVIAGATIMIVARTITESVSLDHSRNSKFVGVRHEAAIVSPTGSDQGKATSPTTIVRNGVTIVSPPLLVPVIDIASLRANDGSDDGASSPKSSNTGKRLLDANRSRPTRQTRWTAYGAALR